MSLEELKHLIVSEKDLVKRIMAKIEPRGLNASLVKLYLAKQKAEQRWRPWRRVDAHRVLDALIGSVTHVSKEKMFADLRTLSENLLIKMDNKRFYICLAPSTNKFERCYFKSNMFLALMMLSLTPDLTKNLVDFLCKGKPLHGEAIDKTVPNYVYLDDASFSGSQAAETLIDLKQHLHESGISLEFPQKLYVVILYANPIIANAVKRNVDVRGAEWLTSDTYPVSIRESLREKGVIFSEEEEIVASKFLRGNLDKPLFFTDLKVADHVSINSSLFYFPVIINADGIGVTPLRWKMENLENCTESLESLITGCPMALEYHNDIVNGDYCPYPIYKSGEWRDFIKDKFQMGRSIKPNLAF